MRLPFGNNSGEGITLDTSRSAFVRTSLLAIATIAYGVWRKHALPDGYRVDLELAPLDYLCLLGLLSYRPSPRKIGFRGNASIVFHSALTKLSLSAGASITIAYDVFYGIMPHGILLLGDVVFSLVLSIFGLGVMFGCLVVLRFVRATNPEPG